MTKKNEYSGIIRTQDVTQNIVDRVVQWQRNRITKLIIRRDQFINVQNRTRESRFDNVLKRLESQSYNEYYQDYLESKECEEDVRDKDESPF